MSTAIILSGGPAFHDFNAPAYPKLLLPIANKPAISYLASALLRAGVKQLFISLDSSMEPCVERLESYFSEWPIRVRCLVQEVLFGTAGTIKEIADKVEGDPFWVASGDVFVHTDLNLMANRHTERRSIATIAASRAREAAWEMERIETDADQRVKAVHRMHPMQNRRSVLRPAGLYLLNHTVLDLITGDSYMDLKEQLFSALHDRGKAADVWEIPGYVRALFSVADYFAVNRDVLLGEVGSAEDQAGPWPEGPETEGGEVSRSATVLDPVALGKGTRIGDRALVIGPTAIEENTEVGQEAVLNQCIVLAEAKIGRGARLDRCIVCEGVEVEEGTKVNDAILADSLAQIKDLERIPADEIPLSSSRIMILGRAKKKKSRASYLRVKRVLDVMFSTAMLLLLSPIMLLVMLAIRLDSRGAAIYRQTRAGRGGHEFVMYKFRSMVPDADELMYELMPSNEVDGPMFKLTSDPRVTRVGKFLRGTNLDELPQLWNVLRGDMSLVGPRPLAMREMRYNPYWRDSRLQVLPGVTGLWQVDAHSKASFAEWLRADLFYVRNMSPGLDFKILIKTLGQSVGEYRRYRGI